MPVRNGMSLFVIRASSKKNPFLICDLDYKSSCDICEHNYLEFCHCNVQRLSHGMTFCACDKMEAQDIMDI